MTTIPATIEIGGALTEGTRIKLARAIVRDGAHNENRWDLDTINDACTVIDNAVTTGTTLTLQNELAAYGHFPTIEAYCREAGLTFTLRCDGTSEWLAELVHFDGNTTYEVVCDPEGEPLVTLETLQKASDNNEIPRLLASLEAAKTKVPALRRAELNTEPESATECHASSSTST